MPAKVSDDSLLALLGPETPISDYLRAQEEALGDIAEAAGFDESQRQAYIEAARSGFMIGLEWSAADG